MEMASKTRQGGNPTVKNDFPLWELVSHCGKWFRTSGNNYLLCFPILLTLYFPNSGRGIERAGSGEGTNERQSGSVAYRCHPGSQCDSFLKIQTWSSDTLFHAAAILLRADWKKHRYCMADWNKTQVLHGMATAWRLQVARALHRTTVQYCPVLHRTASPLSLISKTIKRTCAY